MNRLLPVTEEHVRELQEFAKPEEVAEVAASTGDTIYEAVMRSWNKSVEAYTGVDLEGRVLGITGVAPYNIMSTTASPWLLTTTRMFANKIWFVKQTKFLVNKWRDEWETLENFIDARYVASLKWAKVVGFTVHPPEVHGVQQLPFHRIEIRRT